MKNKKAQMEMMGLVMVVILLIFGLLIYVRIQINNASKEADNIDDTFMIDMSSKVLKTMLHTTSNCNYLDGRQLISDLASNAKNPKSNNDDCNYNTLIQCNSETSKEVLFDNGNGFIKKILDKSLTEETDLNYFLEIKLKNGCIIKKMSSASSGINPCDKAKASYQGEFVFDSDKGKVIATLTVC